MSNQNPPAGWHPDPNTPGQQRYWDGQAWTEQTQSASMPPPPGAPQGGYRDAKADAKAAAAYAKAQRPWYKKKRWIGTIAIVAIVAIAAGSSGGGGDDDAKNVADAPVTNSQKEEPTEEKPAVEEPDNSSKGKGAITWGNWEVVGKLQVTKEEFVDTFAVVARVKNTKDSADRGAFTVTILKGTEILGTATCSTSEVQPGAVATANCFSGDDYKAGFTEVTIENAF